MAVSPALRGALGVVPGRTALLLRGGRPARGLVDAVQQVAGHPVTGSLAQDPSVGRCELEGSPVGSVPGPLQELADEVLLTAVEVAA